MGAVSDWLLSEHIEEQLSQALRPHSKSWLQEPKVLRPKGDGPYLGVTVSGYK